MTWEELLDTALMGQEVEVTLIKPLRKGEHFTKGILCGFKSGVLGGGWHNNNKSYSSLRQRFLKKPKVMVHYNIWQWGKMPLMDWVDTDNCTFKINHDDHIS